MAVTEPDRHDLYQGLEETLGSRRAETFMNLVTTVPWTEVATKSDVAELRAEMHRALRVQLLAFITVVAAFNGLTIAATRLF